MGCWLFEPYPCTYVYIHKYNMYVCILTMINAHYDQTQPMSAKPWHRSRCLDASGKSEVKLAADLPSKVFTEDTLSLQRIKETYGNMLWSGWNVLNGTRLRQDLTRLFRAGSPLLWQHGFATYVLFACKKGTWSQKVGCLLFTIFSTAQNSSLAVRTQHPHAPFFSMNMYRSGRELYSYGYVEALGCK